jgi:hypothetical protein
LSERGRAIRRDLEEIAALRATRRTSHFVSTVELAGMRRRLDDARLWLIRCSAIVLRRASNIVPPQNSASYECRDQPPPANPPDTRPVPMR